MDGVCHSWKMSIPSLSATIIGTLLATRLVKAESGALWLEPSNKYGIDGNWSSIGLSLGEPAQQVDVIVSTSLSEIWVIGADICSSGDDASCAESHGGVYNTNASDTWSTSTLGTWQLGMSSFGLQGKGDYAMENVSSSGNAEKRTQLGKQLVAAINAETDFYTGYFGLGINSANFKDTVAQSPINVLARQAGTIGSRSYGYTAGAYYAGAGGTPLSLTLGGYDEKRLRPHNTIFPLNSSTNELEVTIEKITTSVTDSKKAPTEWPAASVLLTNSSEKTGALIDSSTPFLWLPLAMCEKFQQAFNLTFNDTFGLYFFNDNDALERYRAAPDLTLNFSLSSAESVGSSDGEPETITITISANAFIQELRFPYPNVEGGPDATPMPYFPLKRQKDGGRVVIGRAFMQESYLITNYETGTFSVHQAEFPDDPLATSIKAISADDKIPASSQSTSTGQNGLTKGQLAGVIVGACLGAVVVGVAIWWCLRKRKEGQESRAGHENASHGNGSTMRSKPSFKAATAGLLSAMPKNTPWSRSRRDDTRPQSIESPYPYKSTSSYGYDTPSPPLPVELGARRGWTTNVGAEPYGRNSEDTMAYEIARMGLDPVPMDLGCEYGPPPQEMEEPSYNNSRDMNTTASARTRSPDLGLTTLFPASPSPDEFSESSHSPLSPYADSRSEWMHDITQYPSSQPLVTNRFSTARSNSGHSTNSAVPNSALRSASSHGSLVPPVTPPLIQRQPIDASQQVVCLGPLPSHIPRPHHFPFPPPPPPPPPPQDNSLDTPLAPPRWNRVSTAETLGSNYTVEEEANGRIHGSDIVHIPHLPERRYSWEN